MGTIRAEAIRAHMGFLADDLLEGRDTGSRGYRIAARCVASAFEGVGLEPAGDDGSFFQQVPLRSATLDAEKSSVTLIKGTHRRRLELGRDVLLSPPFRETESTLRAPLVFAGYGVAAPELGQDDYEGLDVEGKVVVVLSGAPSRFPSTERAVYSSREEKAAEALRRGATGLLMVFTDTDTARIPWTFLERALRRASMGRSRDGRAVGGGGRARRHGSSEPRGRFGALLRLTPHPRRDTRFRDAAAVRKSSSTRPTSTTSVSARRSTETASITAPTTTLPESPCSSPSSKPTRRCPGRRGARSCSSP